MWKSDSQIWINFQTFLFLVKLLSSWNGSEVHLKTFWVENSRFPSGATGSTAFIFFFNEIDIVHYSW